MAGSDFRLDTDLAAKDAQRRDRRGHDCRLRVDGELELFFWPSEAEFRKREAGGVVGFRKGPACDIEIGGELLAHPNSLRSLSGKKKRKSHDDPK